MSSTTELQYGECCCCLEKGDHRELTKQYYLDKQPEIYEVLFKDTFDIVLKYPENIKLICDCCVEEVRQAKYFKTMVVNTQLKLSDRVNWQPEFVNVRELEPELSTENIERDSDNQMEEAYNDVQQSDCIMEQLNYDAEEIDIDEENSDIPTVVTPQEPTPAVTLQEPTQAVTLQEPTLAITLQEPTPPVTLKDLKKSAKVLLPRSPTIEQLLMYRRKRLFVCSCYKFKTFNRSHLKKHIRTHTRGKHIQSIYFCDVCPYRSPAKSHVDSHFRRTHLPYSCDICEFTTRQKTTLARHIHTHTGDRPFSCNFCPYRTSIKSFLKQHLLTHPKPFACDMCHFKTATKRYLNIHLLYTHKRKEIDVASTTK